jgi:hypothetical protein
MAGPTKPSPLRLRFHAIGIVPGPKSCPLVQSLRGQRLLSVDAPRLPLVGCSCTTQCDCRFHHYADRRAGPRRSGERGLPAAAWSMADRRRGTCGRRDADFEES